MPTAYSFRPCRLLVPIRSIERAGWKAFGDKIRCKYELVRRSFAVVSSFNVDPCFSLNVRIILSPPLLKKLLIINPDEN